MRKLNTKIFFILLKTKTFFIINEKKKDFNEKHNFNIIINKKVKQKYKFY